MKSLGELIPGVYLESDADGSTAAFIAAYDETHDSLVTAIELIPTANQPRLAPLNFQEYIAAHYGNPFPFMTPERWAEAAKSENLLYMYALRGTAQGIVSVVQYLCGTRVVVTQDFQYCWELGVSQLGGGSPGLTPGFGSAFGVFFGS